MPKVKLSELSKQNIPIITGKIGYDGSDDFQEEIKYLMKKYNVPRSSIVIWADHACGEDVIFINDKYSGYVDDGFYDDMFGEE